MAAEIKETKRELLGELDETVAGLGSAVAMMRRDLNHLMRHLGCPPLCQETVLIARGQEIADSGIFEEIRTLCVLRNKHDGDHVDETGRISLRERGT